MKLKFKNQDFQTDAVNAVADLFQGQQKMRSTFEIVQESQLSLWQNDLGIGNGISISDERLNENMHEVQRRNNLPTSDIKDGMRSFCIEMETGTGKTYVYTKTIFELHKRYGFTKFIIVVPSVAIREGVYKSLDITNEHFMNQYDNVPCRYFIYNSAKLSDVKQFATSSNIEIMIINIDAFKKSENIINQAQDKLNGETAMRYIQDTNPIVIIDEPQSVDNTPKAKEAIASLNPLCVLRYSATHRDKMNLLYRLTPVDAYQMGLVKQICVSQTAQINIQNPGVTYTEREFKTADIDDTYSSLPYILGIISEETLIKRATVARIINESGRAKDFLNNPQAFMEKCLEIIKHNRHALAIDGIKYVKLDGQEYYAQEIFDSAELVANLDKNAVAVNRSIYDHIIYDSSTIEKPFAKALDDDPDAKMFFKIPERFKIETPIGTYNPDWAVYLERDGEKKLFFILETKGTTELFGLRTPEQLKIHCGTEHFKALDNGVEMRIAKDWKEFKVQS